MNYETDNYETGRTNNPLDLALTPGGSSGGEAAAIAACFSAGGMGSDGGGSIRWPAFCCRIAGLKPTPGRVPATGHTPEISHPGGLLGVAGPMARTVEDVRILFEIVAGHDASDPFSAPVPLRAVSLEGVRAGWIEAWPSRRVEEAAKALGAAPFRAPALDRLHELWKFFFFRVNWIFIRQLPQNVHPLGLEWLEEYRDQPPPAAQELLVNLALRDRLRAQFLDAMGEFDVLIAPVALCEAFPHGDRSEFSLDAVRPLTLANILGLPALTVPCGVQLIGRPYEEELLLAVGERLS
jgi:Asp-tRNA(Asn)/Glu-tRNA(Gln) amidotransferase A subunit family amidase